MLYSIFTLPLLATLTICSSISHLSPRQQSLPELKALFQTSDITASGNYNIVYCNSQSTHTRSNKARLLKTLLPLFTTVLEQLLNDVKLGTRSPHGFRALFKTSLNKKIVSSVFQKILNQDPINLITERAQYLGTSTAYPTFVCLEPGNPHTSQALAWCQEDEDTKLTTAPGWEAIFICPHFWNLPASAHLNQCPTVGADNKMVENPDEPGLAETMYGAIVHELVHMYYHKTASLVERVTETYDLQACVDLSAKDSVLNANNYAYYASGRFSFFSLCLMVCWAGRGGGLT